VNLPQKSVRRPKGSGHLRRSEILEAAQRIFVEDGYQGATVRKIAQEVGVSSTAIYMHFPDKLAMVSEIAATAISQLLAQAREIAAEPVDPAIRARQMMAAHMGFALANRSAYSVVFGEAQAEIREGGAHSLGVDYYQCFAAVVGELARQDRLRAGRHPHAVAQIMWAGCHGLVTLLILNPDFGWMPVEELTEAMAETLLAGALKP
jgi:AcrR family transcriptional regulator